MEPNDAEVERGTQKQEPLLTAQEAVSMARKQLEGSCWAQTAGSKNAQAPKEQFGKSLSSSYVMNDGAFIDDGPPPALSPVVLSKEVSISTADVVVPLARSVARDSVSSGEAVSSGAHADGVGSVGAVVSRVAFEELRRRAGDGPPGRGGGGAVAVPEQDLGGGGVDGGVGTTIFEQQKGGILNVGMMGGAGQEQDGGSGGPPGRGPPNPMMNRPMQKANAPTGWCGGNGFRASGSSALGVGENSMGATVVIISPGDQQRSLRNNNMGDQSPAGFFAPDPGGMGAGQLVDGFFNSAHPSGQALRPPSSKPTVPAFLRLSREGPLVFGWDWNLYFHCPRDLPRP